MGILLWFLLNRVYYSECESSRENKAIKNTLLLNLQPILYTLRYASKTQKQMCSPVEYFNISFYFCCFSIVALYIHIYPFIL